MSVFENLDKVRERALRDETFRKRILKTLETDNSVTSFCELCRNEMGVEMDSMELVGAGEAWFTEMIRGRNGGGENSPLIFGEEDPYTMLMMELETLDKKS